jgi:hypothetical protein
MLGGVQHDLRPPGARMPPDRQPGTVPLDVCLRPDELVAAWRPDTRSLLLPTREPLRRQQRVAARITVLGVGVAATITGRVAGTARERERFRVELAPDELRVRAVERLVAVARGEAVHYQPRAPRFLATVPAVVYGAGGPTYMTTFSVSENGCGLAWSGPVPAVGDSMDLRLGAGAQAASVRGVICWISQSRRAATVGVRFLAGERNGWAMVLTGVRRAGAPPA